MRSTFTPEQWPEGRPGRAILSSGRSQAWDGNWVLSLVDALQSQPPPGSPDKCVCLNRRKNAGFHETALACQLKSFIHFNPGFHTHS